MAVRRGRRADRGSVAGRGPGSCPMSVDANVDYGFIDVNTEIGPEHGEGRGAQADLLMRERRSHGVRQSLVRHRTAVHAETRMGNREVVIAAENDDAVVPIAVLSPARSDNLREAEAIAPR